MLVDMLPSAQFWGILHRPPRDVFFRHVMIMIVVLNQGDVFTSKVHRALPKALRFLLLVSSAWSILKGGLDVGGRHDEFVSSLF